MALPTYRIGLVSVESGGTVVTLSGGIWAGGNLLPDDAIAIDGANPVMVTDVVDLNHCTVPRWNGPSKVNVPYVAYQRIPARVTGAETAEDVRRIVADRNAEGYFRYVPSFAADPTSIGMMADEGQYARKASTSEEWLMEGGVWIYQGSFGKFNFDDNDWSAATTYAQRVIVPRAGKLWQSLQAGNINHVPETSSTWWRLFLKGGDAYDIAEFDTDRPASAEIVLDFCVTKRLRFYAGMTDSRARARIGATAAAVYTFKKNGGSPFATMTFAAGGQAGPQQAVFACAADTTFDPATNDYLTITAPAIRDETLSAVSWTIASYRI